MTDPMTVIDAMPAILCAMFFTGAFCGVFAFVAGFWWGSKRTSGETCAIQDLCDRYNALEAENEQLREELKYNLSID